MKPNFCKKCIHCHPYYGNKDKNGKRVISKYYCIKKNKSLNGRIKQCEYRTLNKL